MNTSVTRETRFIDLGLIDYQQAWDYQAQLLKEISGLKLANRGIPDSDRRPTANYLIFCEHPHVFTLGKSGDIGNLRIHKEDLARIQANFVHTNRGGDITYHGPGQIVVYPVVDLDNFFTDIHRYMRTLEESVILTLAELGIHGGRINGLTGVWLDPDDPLRARKICAMGVKMSRWITQHGLALNVNPDLSYFDHIIPCGIQDKKVTSIERETGVADMQGVKEILIRMIASQFDMTLVK